MNLVLLEIGKESPFFFCMAFSMCGVVRINVIQVATLTTS